MKLGCQLAHKLAKVDAAVGCEIEDEARPIQCELDAREFHPEAALAELQQRDAIRFALAQLLLGPDGQVLPRRETDSRGRVGHRAATVVQMWIRSNDGRQRRTAFGLNDDVIAGPRIVGGKVSQHVRLYSADRCQLDEDQFAGTRSVQETPYNCNTSQSATILTPALRSIATSA